MEIRYALLKKASSADGGMTPEQTVALGLRNVMAAYAEVIGLPDVGAIYTADEVVHRDGFGHAEGTMVRLTIEEVPFREVGQ